MEKITTAEKIRILSKRKNKTVSDLARDLGISPQNLHDRLKRNDFRESDLVKIADALGVVYVSDFIEKE